MTSDINTSRRLSIKAVILSNLAFWAVLVPGLIISTITVLVGAGLIALHNSTTTTIDHVMSSSFMIGSWLMVGGVLAPMVAGFTAAKIAPDAKPLHGVLSTSLWLIVAVCCDICGPDTTDMPRWLDIASSYWAPLPALAGAYLAQWRAMRPVAIAGA